MIFHLVPAPEMPKVIVLEAFDRLKRAVMTSINHASGVFILAQFASFQTGSEISELAAVANLSVESE